MVQICGMKNNLEIPGQPGVIEECRTSPSWLGLGHRVSGECKDGAFCSFGCKLI